MNKFVNELVKITGVSKQYAVAAWYTLEHWRRNKPIEAAKYYKQHRIR